MNGLLKSPNGFHDSAGICRDSDSRIGLFDVRPNRPSHSLNNQPSQRLTQSVLLCPMAARHAKNSTSITTIAAATIIFRMGIMPDINSLSLSAIFGLASLAEVSFLGGSERLLSADSFLASGPFLLPDCLPAGSLPFPFLSGAFAFLSLPDPVDLASS